MRVHDVRVPEKVHRDAFYTLVPLNFILKLVGLNCIYRDGTTLKYSWCLPKTTFLVLLFSALNIFNLYNKLFIWHGRISFQFKDAIQVMFLFGYFQYLLDLYYVYRYGRSAALHYLSIYGNIDKVLHMNNYKDIRKCINVLVISFALVVSVPSSIDLTAWFVSYGNAVIVAYIIDYFYVVIRNLSFADVIAQVMLISFRLEAIGDLLKEYYLVMETAPGRKKFVVDKDLIPNEMKDDITIYPRPMKTTDYYESMIKKLNGCYLLILEQSDYVNTMYGVRILGMYLTSFIDVTMTLNSALRIAMGSMVPVYNSGWFPVLSSFVRILSNVFVLCYEVYSCEKCYGQINRIIRYCDCLLVNNNTAVDTKETLSSLRSLVMSRPVRFHAVSFYTLDCALLLSFASSVVTYTIIFMQNLK